VRASDETPCNPLWKAGRTVLAQPPGGDRTSRGGVPNRRSATNARGVYPGRAGVEQAVFYGVGSTPEIMRRDDADENRVSSDQR